MNRLMLKQKLKNQLSINFTRAIVAVMVVVLAVAAVATVQVRADQFDRKISQLEQQNSQKQSVVNQLQSQASSYQDAINKLQLKIDSLQRAIDANLAKQAKLKKQISDAQDELDKQKKVLGESIRVMYVQGQISTLEMLASSDNLSDFIDKQVYQGAVQDKIKETLDKITALKLELQKQKTEVEQLLQDQKDQQSELNDSKSKQDQLLHFNQRQQSNFNSQIAGNQAKIAKLRRQQLIANARFLGGTPGTGPACGGGYPGRWCEVPQDTVYDNWGMWNRECVSYTAFKVAASGRHMPSWGWQGVGNANQWDDNAREAGIPVDGNPRVGDVAQTDAGGLGHVMYVEYVYGDGTIYISQYNAGLDGRYSEKRISAGGLNFIHFP